MAIIIIIIQLIFVLHHLPLIKTSFSGQLREIESVLWLPLLHSEKRKNLECAVRIECNWELN